MTVEEARDKARRERGDHVCLEALERARAMQERHGYRRAPKPPAFTGQRRTARRSEPTEKRSSEGFIGEDLKKILANPLWARHLAVAKLEVKWPQIVGEHVASHVRVKTFDNGVLTLEAASNAWAANLNNLLPTLERAVENEVGVGIVEKIVITSAIRHTFKRGPLSVPGRGVRDTYD
ncbi:MAG: DUF721 domain-containing protein [Flaviflexus sp.]|nr:DUF721 domain-containing protein [Flaviflexus sp.]